MRGPRNGPRTPPVADARLVPVSLAFGVAYGGAMPLYPVVTREFFGERAMGTAYGAVFFISCIGMGLGSYREVPFTPSWALSVAVPGLVRDRVDGGCPGGDTEGPGRGGSAPAKPRWRAAEGPFPVDRPGVPC